MLILVIDYTQLVYMLYVKVHVSSTTKHYVIKFVSDL
jgi:hypothetical protein